MAKSARQLFRGLAVNLDGFEQVCSPKWFTVTSAGRDFAFLIDNPAAQVPQSLELSMVAQGGGGVFRAVAGLAMIAVSFIVPGAGFLLSAGVAFTAGGVLELLTPKPKANESSKQDRAQSYLFSSIDNNADDADPIPLAFGRCRLQGIPAISTEITHES